MQLILRTTGRCNFKCDFCSASKLEQKDMSLETVKQAINRYKPKSVIFEGGDPLCRKPSFYKEIIDWTDKNNPNIAEYGITSNMWDFYKHPEKWVDLFKHPKMANCTSFQYGNRRKLSDKLIFTEDLFLKVFNKYLDLIGQRLPFISVIDNDNEQYSLKTVELAKSLDTICKLNPAVSFGKQDHAFSYAKMYSIYADIIEADLAKYESNSLLILQIIYKEGQSRSCPFNRYCANDFRAISPSGQVSTCSYDAYNTDHSTKIQFYNKNHEQTILKDVNNALVHPKCLNCQYFNWCNSCRIQIASIKLLENLDQHCQLIKQSINRIYQYAKNHPNYFDE